MAPTSSMNCLSSRTPCQKLQSLNASTSFSEKHCHSKNSISSLPFPKCLQPMGNHLADHQGPCLIPSETMVFNHMFTIARGGVPLILRVHRKRGAEKWPQSLAWEGFLAPTPSVRQPLFKTSDVFAPKLLDLFALSTCPFRVRGFRCQGSWSVPEIIRLSFVKSHLRCIGPPRCLGGCPQTLKSPNGLTL